MKESADKIILRIAVGRSRKETRWRTEEWTWERLAQRLADVRRTPETAAEYATSGKERRTELKDCGGFVGGAVEGGRRRRGSVPARRLLTLDADNATEDLWEEFRQSFDCAAVLYTTHSHTARNPRYRLVVPLSRAVSPEEYEAVARTVTGPLGPDRFDPSTYEAERLMYWPSAPRDGEWEYRRQDGPALDVEGALRSYGRDWRDTVRWPTGEREARAVRDAIRRQGDPETKPGAVGRFCRARDVPSAIAAYLPETYRPAGEKNRYTYIPGTAEGGLVVYDGGKFAYSHHGTDPAHGRLLNAFDLVRLHRFAALDETAAEGTPVNRLPSYAAMEELAGKDPEVRRQDAEETRRRVREDFAEAAGAAATEADDAWLEKLDRGKKGQVANSAANALAIALNAPGLKGNLRRDLLARRDYAERDLPWRKVRKQSWTWTDADDANWRNYLAAYGVTTKQYAQDALEIAFDRAAFHPVRRYLLGLPEWDGRPRLDRLLTDYLGAADDALTRAVARKALTAAVARVMDERPGGVKFDYCTVLAGPEGIGKSTLVRRLFAPWFTDSVTTLSGKEAMEQLQGAWGVELGELSAIRRTELEGVKAFLSKTEDRYRPAYGRNTEIAPRQCVFFATTNEKEFLKGDTGNRRFWLVDCPGAFPPAPWSEEARGQIWAEALRRWRDGEPLWLGPELEAAMRQRQEAHHEGASDPRPGMIAAYLDLPLPADWARRDVNQRACYVADEEAQEREGSARRDRVCAAEVLCELFRRPMGATSRYEAREINEMLSRVPGWRYAGLQRFGIYGRQKGFLRDFSENQNGTKNDEK